MSGFTIFDIVKAAQKKYFPQPKLWGRAVPREEWAAGEFYSNMRNDVWRKITNGKFPAKDVAGKDTHTLYVRSVSNYSVRICPTSTQYQYDRPCGYVRRNTPLDENGHVQPRDVYILTSLTFPMPQRKVMGEEELRYAGRCPEDSVEELD